MMKMIEKYSLRLKDPAVFCKPDIPLKKLGNAIHSYASSIQIDDVLVLVDDTFFGSAKDGLIITADRIFAKEIASKPISFSLASITGIGVEQKKILINDIPFAELPSIADEDIILLVELISVLSNCREPSSEENHINHAVEEVMALGDPVNAVDQDANVLPDAIHASNVESPSKKPNRYVWLWAIIFGFAALQHQMLQFARMDEGLMHGLVVAIVLLVLIIGGIGTIFAHQGKFAIFTSEFDVLITGVAIIFGILNIQDWDDQGIAKVAYAGSMLFNALFLWLSYSANQSFLKLLVVIPSKVFCVALLILIGLLTVITAMGALQAAKERKYGKAAGMAGASVASGTGTLWMTRFLQSLIKKTEMVKGNQEVAGDD